MGYFTETMALFEFKGDAENAYTSRNAAEKLSGDHQIGKAAYAAGKGCVNYSGSTKNKNEYEKRKQDFANRKRIADAVNDRDDVRDDVKDGMNDVYKDGKKNPELNRAIHRYQNGSNKGMKSFFKETLDSIIL